MGKHHFQLPQDPECRDMTSRAIELELDARDQERMKVTNLVEQARQQVQRVLQSGGTQDDLSEAEALLSNAIDVLKWPLVKGLERPEGD